MLDITLLQVMKEKNVYEYYRPMIRDHLVDEKTLTLLFDFGAYFEHFPKQDRIDFNTFPTWWKQFRHPNMKKDDVDFYEKVLENVKKDPNPDGASTLKEKLSELNFATIVANKAHDLIDGKMKGEEFILEVQEEVERCLEEKQKNGDVPWDTSSLSDLAEQLSYDAGLKFGLSCLDESCGSLHASKFIVVGAYVDSGKSTFLADQFVANMLRQIIDINNADKWFYNRPIMWFNNEGSTKDIKMYCFQSLFGASYDRIQSNPIGAEKAYKELTKDNDPVKIIPCQGWHIKEAERVIKMYKPAVVIYDMLDNFNGFETDGTIDQRYRALYDYARQISDKYSHVAVATSQCVGEANGQERIEMHQLAGSRVAKQSTADLIIMIGRSLEAGKNTSRYIYTPKNKLQAQPRKNFDRFTNTEVIFNGEIKRFLDPVEG